MIHLHLAVNVTDVRPTVEGRDRGDARDMPLESPIGQSLDETSPHPTGHIAQDRLVKRRQDLHFGEDGQVEKVLLLADPHPGLDADIPPLVIGIDHEAVVRRPDLAELHLLLQLLEAIKIVGLIRKYWGGDSNP